MIAIGRIITDPYGQCKTIAIVFRDDKQTGEYLLQEKGSARGLWYRTLDLLKADLADNDITGGYAHSGLGAIFTPLPRNAINNDI